MRRGVDSVSQANEQLSRRDAELGAELAASVRAQQATQLQLVSIVNSAMDAIISIDAEQRILLCNAAAEEIFGYGAEEMMRGSLDRLLPSYVRGQHSRFIDHFPRGASSSRRTLGSMGTLRAMRRSGQEFPIEASISHAEVDGLDVFTVIVRDISERLEAFQAIKDREDRLRSVTESLNEGLILVSPEGRLLQWNPAGLRMHGYESLEDGASLPDFRTTFVVSTLDGEVLPFESWPLSRILAGETLSAVEVRLQRPEVGLDRIYRYSGSLIKDGGGRPVAFLALGDVTDEKLAQSEVAALNAELEQRVADRTAQLEAANKELEAFSYSVSHDLRAPLRAMDGYSVALVEDFGTVLPAEALRYLETIRKNTRRMGQLIDALLDFSRLSRSALNKRTVSVDSLFRQAFEDLANQHAGREVQVRIEDMPTCQADPTLLSQVCINLVSNALKYTQRQETTIIEVGGYRQEGDSIYYIRDNGTGFDMRYADKLFGVFQRLHRAEDFEGTGVGLAIVGRVVGRHGGRVWAEAAPDQGATFFFSLSPSDGGGR